MERRLASRVRRHREGKGLSQQALAERAGVSRQAIVAIESGRQVPSTTLSLELARVLGCGVEDLFHLVPVTGLNAVLAPGPASGGARVRLGLVDGRWIAHPLGRRGDAGADGVIIAADGTEARVQLLADPERLDRTVLIAGCAPILGVLASRVADRFDDARVTWMRASSNRALALLAEGLVHVAGLHPPHGATGQATVEAVRRALPGRDMLVVNLTRWSQGLALARGNPLGIRSGADLGRGDLRFAWREEGSGAHQVTTSILEEDGASVPTGPLAGGHHEVARLVRRGAADVGVAIEAAAVAEGLDFVPLSSERFDLVMPAVPASVPPLSRVIATLDGPSFRVEMTHVPGYDCSITGEVTAVGAE